MVYRLATINNDSASDFVNGLHEEGWLSSSSQQTVFNQSLATLSLFCQHRRLILAGFMFSAFLQVGSVFLPVFEKSLQKSCLLLTVGCMQFKPVGLNLNNLQWGIL